MAKRKKQSGMKKGITPQQRPQQAQKGYYFVVAGEIEYHNGDEHRRYAKANAIHVEPIATGKPDGVTVQGLAQIQTALQVHFHAHYSKTHPKPPTITNVTLLSVSHLGIFTQAEFYQDAREPARAPVQGGQTLPTETKAAVAPREEFHAMGAVVVEKEQAAGLDPVVPPPGQVNADIVSPSGETT